MNNPYQVKINSNLKYTGAQIAIQKALIRLLFTNKLEKINVKQICQEAAVARSSFYTYYESISDLLTEIEDSFVNELVILDRKITDENRKTAGDFSYLSKLFDFIEQRKTLIKALLIKNYDYHLVTKWKKAIKYNLWERMQPKDNSLKTQLSFEMFASEVIAAYIFAIDHRNEINDEEIYDLTVKALKILE